MKDVSKKIKLSYQKKFSQFGVGPKSLFWGSKGAAHQRFRQFWAEIDFSGKSVLDVGCGFGELGNFLTKRYENVNYTGIDIVPEFIAEAKKLYPSLNFIEGDYFGNPLAQKFDVIICSGGLNSNVADNTDYRTKAIKTMYTYSNKIAAFNMLGGFPQPETKTDSNVWYADSLKILKTCMEITPRVILRAHYHPKDFTIFMYKKHDK